MIRNWQISSIILLCWGIWATAGCGGGASANIRVTAFTEEHAKFFEDGVDFVADPALLEYKVAQQWQSDLESRWRLSDFVGIMTVSTVVADEDLEKQTTYRLVSTINKTLQGNAPGDELRFAVREGSEGYPRVEKNHQRILNHQFVAYVKWYKQETGQLSMHWHLSPASPPVVSQLNDLVARSQNKNKVVRVVIQKQ